MKIQCDVCEKEEASVFCTADEAALCNACDHRVHHANKLAGKHPRFSLLPPSFKDNSPRCDICQERRAFLFCQEDRAILCRECDVQIHKANERTQKHNRFLLTGVKLSSSSSSSSTRPAASSSSIAAGGEATATNNLSKIKRSACSNPVVSNPCSTQEPLPSESASTPSGVDDHCISQECSISTSSISEYLMQTLPGWSVDDFLDPSSSSHGFCKTYDDEQRIPDHGFGSDLDPLFGDSAIWVPQFSHVLQFLSQSNATNALLKGSEEADNMKKTGCRRGGSEEDGSFRVPQISHIPPDKWSFLW
ncbi:LOW QUALITY PROTEIN: B-box zinc finger protein 20 [Diospyros lotus]|uniref:LOW QUALITY PROTEIN: B-box zinc finger protein 20 n=1 Tax=Diospyros lotus TaxID=55363 RepID=UPI002256CEC5|nr:LOW QUALITY PROTEIN: B-box zinc finger protein 20 [Diospyros lotus]